MLFKATFKTYRSRRSTVLDPERALERVLPPAPAPSPGRWPGWMGLLRLMKGRAHWLEPALVTGLQQAPVLMAPSPVGWQPAGCTSQRPCPVPAPSMQAAGLRRCSFLPQHMWRAGSGRGSSGCSR